MKTATPQLSSQRPKTAPQSGTFRQFQGSREPQFPGPPSAPAAVPNAPIESYDPTHEEVAQRAYELYMAKGCRDGEAESDWCQAERELRERAQEKSKAGRMPIPPPAGDDGVGP